MASAARDSDGRADNRSRRRSCARSCALFGCSPFLLIAVIAVISARLHRAPPPVYTQDVTTVTGGQIVGTIKDGIRSYKGIPFAAPPVGPNRWRAPQPVVPWKGVRKAQEYGPAPMQNRAVAMFYSAKLNVKVSEDCLYLNVWTPARRAGEKLPVMFWIYGGAFSSGLTGSPLYDGSSLAKKGVIVVSVGYRVGPFGFLAHPALSRESGHGSGTYGLQDMAAGLRWVKNNIARFGGDPGNVTIFGESAGGTAVNMLAASPLARGLFHRAIAQSAGHPFAPVKRKADDITGPPPLAMAEQQGEAFLARLGVKNIEAARALPADAVQKATEGAGAPSFTMPLDGYVLPDDPYRLFLAGKFNYTPILVGTNSDDAGMFTPPGMTLSKYRETVKGIFGDKADALLTAYPAATDAEAARAARHLLRDMTLAWGTWTWARLQSRQDKGAAYLYYFDRHDAKSPEGAAHGAEVPFVFGHVDPLFGRATPEDRAFSETMQRYWTNFARTGNPNGPGLTPWPAFREPDARVLKFATDVSVQPIPNLEQLKVLDSYFAGRRARESVTPRFQKPVPGMPR